MPRASRKPVRKNVDDEIMENFSSLISSLSSSSDIQKFFIDFLTREEQIMLSKGLMLHLMLERGYKNNQIQGVLGISKDTVRTHRAIWERGGTVYKEILRKIAKKAQNREFWEKLEKVFRPLELALKAKTDMKARAKFATGDWD